MFFVFSSLFTRRFLPKLCPTPSKVFSKLLVLFVLVVFPQNCLFSFAKWFMTMHFWRTKKIFNKNNMYVFLYTLVFLISSISNQNGNRHYGNCPCVRPCAELPSVIHEALFCLPPPNILEEVRSSSGSSEGDTWRGPRHRGGRATGPRKATRQTASGGPE